jgi:N-acyl-D-amino-acid deacylase
MSGATADRFQLKDRGYLKEGCFADITVFNEEEMKNGVPDQYRPFGIIRVIINGRTVLDGDKLDEQAIKTSGRVIRCS